MGCDITILDDGGSFWIALDGQTAQQFVDNFIRERSKIIKILQHLSPEIHVFICVEGNVSSHLLHDVRKVLIQRFHVFACEECTFELFGVHFDCDSALEICQKGNFAEYCSIFESVNSFLDFCDKSLRHCLIVVVKTYERGAKILLFHVLKIWISPIYRRWKAFALSQFRIRHSFDRFG